MFKRFSFISPLEYLFVLFKKIRKCFSEYEDIVPGLKLASLSYLHACIEETLPMLPSNNTGLPRISPGAMVDRQYIPKGVSILIRHWPAEYAFNYKGY